MHLRGGKIWTWNTLPDKSATIFRNIAVNILERILRIHVRIIYLIHA